MYFAMPFTLFLWTSGTSRQIIEALHGLCISFSSLTNLLHQLAARSLEMPCNCTFFSLFERGRVLWHGFADPSFGAISLPRMIHNRLGLFFSSFCFFHGLSRWSFDGGRLVAHMAELSNALLRGPDPG